MAGKKKLYSLGSISVLIVLIYAVTFRWRNILIGVALGDCDHGFKFVGKRFRRKVSQFVAQGFSEITFALAFGFTVVSAGMVFLFVFVGKTFVADVYAARP